MRFLNRTVGYVVNHTKRQSTKELKNDPRVDKITSGLNKLTVITKPIIPKGFPGDEIFIYPVGIFKITINISKRNLRDVIKLTNRTYRLGHPHILSGNSICWGDIEKELMIMKRHKDWYWIVKRVLDFLNDFGIEGRRAPYRVNENWVDYRLRFQLIHMKNDAKVKKRLIVLKKIYMKKYRIYKNFRSDFR